MARLTVTAVMPDWVSLRSKIKRINKGVRNLAGRLAALEAALERYNRTARVLGRNSRG